MAGRNKNDREKSAGDARLDPGDFERQKEEMLRVVQQKLEEQDFDSSGETNEFLARHFTGKTMDEILESERSVPETPEDRALVEIRGIDGWRDDQTTVRRAARRALKIDPDCVEAHALLGDSAGSPKHAIPFYRKAIDAGRRRFADLIEDCRGKSPEEGGLWGFVETRPFLRAMQSLAACHFVTGDMPGAIALEEEILRINASDNQGVRETLLLHYLVDHRLEDAEDLLGRYEDDISAAFRFTEPLLAFIKIFEDSNEQQLREIAERGTALQSAAVASGPEVDAGQIAALIKVFGSKFKAPTQRLRKEVCNAPWAGIILRNSERYSRLPQANTISFGGPHELVEYARLFGGLWRNVPMALDWLDVIMADVLNEMSPETTKALERFGGDFDVITEELEAISPAVSRAHVGRNDPCPCGSGRKFKKCCGAS